MDKAKVTRLLVNAGANATGGWIEMPPWRESGRGMVVAAIAGTGSIAVAVQGSHDGANAETIGTITPDGATDGVKSQAIDYPWPYLRAVSSGKAGTVDSLKVTVAQ